MSAADIALSPGTRLVHVGPHKTGTTAIQGSLHYGRKELAPHGVWLPSPRISLLDEAQGVIVDDPQDPRTVKWQKLVERVKRTGDRIAAVSSEFLSDANPEACDRIVRDLGGDRVHVVVTLRPLVKILPSTWQQMVRNRLTLTYDEWLRRILLDGGEGAHSPMFWHRQRHDAFVERWAAAAGPENVTVVVVDDADKGRLLRDFEALLGLPDGLLKPVKRSANRSLTAGETEFVRRCSEAFISHGLPNRLYLKYIRHGAIPFMQTSRGPDPGEAKIATPMWAQERAAAISDEVIDRIGSAGVRIVGDLKNLRGPDPFDPKAESPKLAPDAAVQAIVRVMQLVEEEASGKGGKAAPVDVAPPPAEVRHHSRPVDEVRTADLVRLVGRRIRHRMGAAIRGRSA